MAALKNVEELAIAQISSAKDPFKTGIAIIAEIRKVTMHIEDEIEDDSRALTEAYDSGPGMVGVGLGVCDKEAIIGDRFTPDNIKKALQMPLPGYEAQVRMSPSHRAFTPPPGKDTPFVGAVMLLLYPGDEHNAPLRCSDGTHAECNCS